MSLPLKLIKLFAFPLVIGSIATPLALYGKFGNNKQISTKEFSLEELKRNCYIIVSSWNNESHLSVCSKGNSLKFYLVEQKNNNLSTQKIEKIVSSTGDAVIVELLNKTNVPISGIKNKTQVIKDLFELIKHGVGLKSKCQKIENTNDKKVLNCGSKQIPLTSH